MDTQPTTGTQTTTGTETAAAAQTVTATRVETPASDMPANITALAVRPVTDLLANKPKESLLESLPADEQALARQTAQQVDVTTDTAVIKFGEGVMADITKSAREVVEQVGGDPTAPIEHVLSTIKSIMADLDLANYNGDPDPWYVSMVSWVPVLGTAVSKNKRFEVNKRTVGKRVDALVINLSETEAQGEQNAARFQQLLGVNRNLVGRLQVLIAAAEIVGENLEKYYAQQVAGLQGTKDLRRYEDVAALASRIELFYATVNDIHKARLQTFQRGPRLKVGEQNANRLIQVTHSLSQQAIPNILMELGTAVLQQEQKRILAVDEAVQDLNEQLTLSNTDRLADMQRRSLKAQQRGIASLQTLRTANDKLLGLLDEGLKLIDENRKVRAEEQKAMGEMEQQVRSSTERFVKALAERKSSTSAA